MHLSAGTSGTSSGSIRFALFNAVNVKSGYRALNILSTDLHRPETGDTPCARFSRCSWHPQPLQQPPRLRPMRVVKSLTSPYLRGCMGGPLLLSRRCGDNRRLGSIRRARGEPRTKRARFRRLRNDARRAVRLAGPWTRDWQEPYAGPASRSRQRRSRCVAIPWTGDDRSRRYQPVFCQSNEPQPSCALTRWK